MNGLPGPVAKRDLEALIGLERFEYSQLGFGNHQQGMRDTSAWSRNGGFPDTPLRRQEAKQR
jgi:hypothetical protein